MKHSLHVGLAILCSLPAFGEIENEIPLGMEAVTGIRTGYVYRGFELAQTSLDFQIEAEFALSNTETLNFGSWYLSEGDGDFSETGVFIDFRHELDPKTVIGASLTYRNFSGAQLDNGLDLGVFATYQINDDWDWKAGAYYDLGNDAFYSSFDVRWSKPISDSAFVSLENGLSYVSDYLDRDGLNDYYGRLSLTYAVSNSVAFTPFIGWSFQLDSDDDDSVHGGLLFEVIF